MVSPQPSAMRAERSSSCPASRTSLQIHSAKLFSQFVHGLPSCRNILFLLLSNGSLVTSVVRIPFTFHLSSILQTFFRGCSYWKINSCWSQDSASPNPRTQGTARRRERTALRRAQREFVICFSVANSYGNLPTNLSASKSEMRLWVVPGDESRAGNG